MRNPALKMAVQIVILALSVLLLGSWDNVDWSKITVTALKPGNKIGTFESGVELSWGLIPGADRYEVQSSTTLQDLAISPASEVKAGTFFTLTSMEKNKIDEIWYWRVRAINNTGEATAWSTTRQVFLNIGGAVTGLNPARRSSTTSTTSEFSWNAVDGAAKYQIQIAGREKALEGSPPVDEEVSGTSYTPTTGLTNLQAHYWRVRAVDGEGQAGAWSTVYLFWVEWGAVTGLIKSSTTSTTPEFSWNAVDRAARYQIQIAGSRSVLEGSPPVDEEVIGTSYMPAPALTDHQVPYWRVRAVDGEGQVGNWSSIHSFGGIVFYDKGRYTDGWRYLEAAPSDQGRYEWGGDETAIGGTGTGIGRGKANTEKIVAKLEDNGGDDYAAKICADLELGGYDDWFLPSKDELNELYKHKEAVGGFSSVFYWSSSEDGSMYAWGRSFGSGSQDDDCGGSGYRVRAVRAF